MDKYYKITETRKFFSEDLMQSSPIVPGERLENIVQERVSNGPKDTQLLCYNEVSKISLNTNIV